MADAPPSSTAAWPTGPPRADPGLRRVHGGALQRQGAWGLRGGHTLLKRMSLLGRIRPLRKIDDELAAYL